MNEPIPLHAVHWSATTQRLRPETIYVLSRGVRAKGNYTETVYFCNREPDGSGAEIQLTDGQAHGLDPDADDALGDDGATWYDVPRLACRSPESKERYTVLPQGAAA